MKMCELVEEIKSTIDPKFWDDFLLFVGEGKTNPEFEIYSNSDKNCMKGIDKIQDQQSKVWGEIGKLLGENYYKNIKLQRISELFTTLSIMSLFVESGFALVTCLEILFDNIVDKNNVFILFISTILTPILYLLGNFIKEFIRK